MMTDRNVRHTETHDWKIDFAPNGAEFHSLTFFSITISLKSELGTCLRNSVFHSKFLIPHS